MKMTKKLVLAAATLPLLLGTASAFAFGGKNHQKGFEGKCGGLDKNILRQLDLTDEQEDQFKAAREAGREAMKGQRGDKFAGMQAHHEKAQTLLLADTFDEVAANELAQEMVAKQAEKRVAMMKKQHELLNILTVEQKDQLKELQQERMQECSEKMQKHKQKNQ